MVSNQINKHVICQGRHLIFFEISPHHNFGLPSSLTQPKFWATLGVPKRYLIRLAETTYKNAFILCLILKTHLDKKITKTTITREHKPRTNGNVGSMIKQHAKTTGHDIHPNYANSLETGINPGQRALSRVITFITGQELC